MKAFLKKWWLLLALMLFQSAVSVWVAWHGDFIRQAHRDSITFTMRYCTVIFSLAYMARGLQVIFKTGITRSLLANRKILGIAFAYSFVFHLFQLIALDKTITLSAFMFIQFVPVIFVNLLGITSLPVVQRNMSVRFWKLLHQWGMAVIWLALFKNYILIFFVPSLLGDRSIFYFGTFLVGITPFVRLYLIYRKRQRQQITAEPDHLNIIGFEKI